MKKTLRYKLWIKFNDTEHNIKTDDIALTLQELKPQFIKTKVLIKVADGKKNAEKVLNLKEARRMWLNAFNQRLLVNRLIFK